MNGYYKTRFHTTTSGQMAYTDTGNKASPPLLFFHGLPTCKELFFPVLDSLRGEYRLITFDLHDYGESEKCGHVPHRQRAKEAGELLEVLGVTRFTLIAHDLGSSVAIDMMDLFSHRIDKFIIMSPPVYPEFKEPPVVKLVRIPGLGFLLLLFFKKILLQAALKKGLHRKMHYEKYLKSHLEKAFSGKSGASALLRDLRWGTPKEVFKDYPSIFKNIKIPTLIIHGRHDPYIPLEHSFWLQRDIRDSRLAIIEEGSHFLPIDTPVELAELIDKFLQSGA